MFIKLDKLFFIFSLFFTDFLCRAVFLIPDQGGIKKSFLVCGVHSRVPSMAYFKPIRAVKSNRTRGASLSTKKTKKVVKKAITKSKKLVAKKNETKKNPIKTAKLRSLKREVAKKKPVKKKMLMAKKDKKKKLQRESEKKILKKEESTENVDLDLLGRDSPESLACKRQVKGEVERLWRPPIGVAKGTESVLSLVIDVNGSIEKFEFIKKSNVLLYDLSISRVVNKFKFLNLLWGRTLKITFRQ